MEGDAHTERFHIDAVSQCAAGDAAEQATASPEIEGITVLSLWAGLNSRCAGI
jgi:hypothetical protein